VAPFDLPNFWTCDLDGAGKEEFLFARSSYEGRRVRAVQTRIQATRGGAEQILWEWLVPGQNGSLMGSIPSGEKGRSPIVLVRATPNVLYGLDGRNGKPLWKGHGLEGDVVTHVEGGSLFGSALLMTSGPAGMPRIVGHQHQTTICRLVQRLDGGAESGAESIESVVQRREDPRLVHPLPWPAYVQPSLHWLLLLPGPVLLLLWVALVRASIRRRSVRFGLAAVLLPVLVAALAWLGLRTSVLRGLPPVALVAGLPGAILILVVARDLARRRWRRVTWVVLASLVLSIAIGGIWIYRDLPQLDADQHYAWRAWSWLWTLWIQGAYATGCLILLGTLLVMAFRGCRRVIVACAGSRACTL
jgi:hypothetical protein